jgi:hypothetical protein
LSWRFLTIDASMEYQAAPPQPRSPFPRIHCLVVRANTEYEYELIASTNPIPKMLL